MKYHAQHGQMTVKVAQCHTVNVGRVNHKVVSREEFKTFREEWRCKRCQKAIEAGH